MPPSGRHKKKHTLRIELGLPSRRTIGVAAGSFAAAVLTYVEQRYGTTLAVLTLAATNLGRSSR